MDNCCKTVLLIALATLAYNYSTDTERGDLGAISVSFDVIDDPPKQLLKANPLIYPPNLSRNRITRKRRTLELILRNINFVDNNSPLLISAPAYNRRYHVVSIMNLFI